MEKFIITTNKKTASEIEAFFKSVVSRPRSIALGKIYHSGPVLGEEGYTTVEIIPSKPGKPIDPVDIFWMGYFTRTRLMI